VRQEEDKQQNYFALFKFLLFTLMFIAVLVAQARHPCETPSPKSSTRLLVESSERAAKQTGVSFWSASVAERAAGAVHCSGVRTTRTLWLGLSRASCLSRSHWQAGTVSGA